MPSGREIDQQTIAIIKAQEGFSPGAYKDAGGHSIGYGHFIKPGEDYGSRTLSEEEATELLKKDIASHQDPWIGAIKKDLSDTQIAALTSFAYNAGPGSARKAVELINKEGIEAAASYMSQFTKARVGPGGPKVEVAALVGRRAYETEMLTSANGRSAVEILESKRGVFDKLKTAIMGRTRDARSSEDGMDEISNTSAEILQSLREFNASRKASSMETERELAWATRVMAEGRGWAAP